jgi:hypothetical protein
MLCAHAEKLIPLFAGDDLPPREANAIRLHLESCANCRRLAAEFAESRAWLCEFDEPQFDEATLDGMRDSVLRNIDRIENRSRQLQWVVPGWNLRFAFATSLTLLLCAALFILAVNRRDQESNRAELPPDLTTDGQLHDDKRIAIDRPVRRKSGRKRVRPAPQESPQTEAGGIEPDLMTQTPAADHEVDQSGVDDPDTNRDMLRIELQTADPNIRIIWFAPKSDAAPRK